MTIQFVNQSEKRLLDLILADAGGWSVKLFKNDKTPAAADTAASYTQATFPGYIAQGMSVINWPAATTDGDGKASAQYAVDITFTCTGGTAELVYGFFVTDGAGNVVMAERFPAPGPYSMALNGDAIKVRPTLTLYDPATAA